METALTVPAPASPPFQTRRCKQCGEEKPVAAFWSETSQQRGTCRRCTALFDRFRYTDKERRKLVEWAAKQFAASVRGNKIDVPHITELCAGVYALFGSNDPRKGLEGFCKSLHAFITDPKTPAGVRMKGYGFIIRLTELSTQYRDTAPDVAGLSEEELSQEMAAILLEGLSRIANEVEEADDEEETT